MPPTTACSRSSCASSRSRSAPLRCSSWAGACASDVPSTRQLLQGGGIAGLYLTVFAATRLYQLLPPGLAFGLLAVIALAAAVLAVAQNALPLAVIGTAGGFLAPILVSTGSGNYVALFTYYALLNLGVFAVAWFKTWRVLNVLGFLFTFTITGLWRANSYQSDDLVTADGFLILFFLMYVAVSILNCVRQPPNLKGYVSGSLVFGLPVVAFTLHATHDLAHRVRARLERVRARCFLPAARLDPVPHASRNLPPARRSLRRARRDLREPRDPAGVRHAHDGCDVGGRRCGTALARRASGAQVAALVRHLAAGRCGCRISDRLRRDALDAADPQQLRISALRCWRCPVSSVATGCSATNRGARSTRPGSPAGSRSGESSGGSSAARTRSVVISRMSALGALLVYASVAAAILTWLGISRQWPLPRWIALFLPAVVGAYAFAHAQRLGHPFAQWGAVGWLAIFVTHFTLLRIVEPQRHVALEWLHGGACWALALLFAWELDWQVAQRTAGVWASLAWGLVPALMLGVARPARAAARVAGRAA